MKKVNLFTFILVVLGIIGFFYIASRFGGGEKGVESEKPITTCQNNQCFYTAHLHMTIEGVTLPYEKGNLQGNHTHAERNVVHWHSTLPVDPNTKEVTDWSPLKLENVLDEFGVTYTDGVMVKVMVNGQEKEDWQDYVWQDGDIIKIIQSN